MCGATSEQKQLEQQQANFYSTLTAEYGEALGQFKALTATLTNALTPIINAGPDQEGFGANELMALRSGATERVAEEYQKGSQALGERQAAQEGSDFQPSGARDEQSQELVQAAAGETAREQTQITEADYATGRQNYWQATQELAGVTGMWNPNSFAGSATNAGEAASKTANEIAQAGNAWMGPVFGMIGAIGGAAMGHLPTGGGGDNGGGDEDS